MYTLASLPKTLSLSSNMDPRYCQYWFANTTMTPSASKQYSSLEAVRKPYASGLVASLKAVGRLCEVQK